VVGIPIDQIWTGAMDDVQGFVDGTSHSYSP
jgi:hypothetical protein